jgi:predicted DNA-binding transcriptional regulator AlpA
MPHTLMNMRALMSTLSIRSRTTVYQRLQQDPSFPRPLRMNRRFLRWRRADVEAYVGSLPEAQFSAASEAPRS